YWDPAARGAVLGLTRDTGINHVVRAALESVCYQTRDLLEAMTQDSVASADGNGMNLKSLPNADAATGSRTHASRHRVPVAPTALRVDGGMVVNDWVVQFLSDLLRVPIERPTVVETTALGAAYLAGLQSGVYHSLDEIAQLWLSERRFEPGRPQERMDRLYQGWRDAVARVRSVAQ
ncbi:MAG: FGGY-family carbohydrate kinase, partial [Nevskiales bacterium]